MGLFLHIAPLKTDPDTAMQFIEQLAVKEKRELTESDKQQIRKFLQLAHDKHTKQNKNNMGFASPAEDL